MSKLKTTIIFLIIIFGFLLLPKISLAAPNIYSVSGNLTNNSQITVSGSGFGTKSTPHPVFYDNFDSNDTGRQNGDGIRGKDASHYGAWDTDEWKTAPTYTNQNPRGVSVLSSNNYMAAGTGYDAALNSSCLFETYSVGHQPIVLLSFWTRFTHTGDNSGATDPNTPGWWQVKYIHQGPDDSVGATNLQLGWHWNSTGGAPPYYDNAWNLIKFYGVPSYYFNYGVAADESVFKDDGTWQNIIIFMKASTGDATANGSLIAWVDGHNFLNYPGNMVTFQTGEVWNSFRFGWYLGNAGNGSGVTADIQFDDVYIDTSWQSIWIGDANQWANCTHREIQIPSGWSNNSITLAFNQGSFSAGQTAYLFVLDSNGNPSAGYPITIGGSQPPDTTPPAAPTGVTVQ